MLSASVSIPPAALSAGRKPYPGSESAQSVLGTAGPVLASVALGCLTLSIYS